MISNDGKISKETMDGSLVDCNHYFV